jgi:hypothetical protein
MPITTGDTVSLNVLFCEEVSKESERCSFWVEVVLLETKYPFLYNLLLLSWSIESSLYNDRSESVDYVKGDGLTILKNAIAAFEAKRDEFLVIYNSLGDTDD